MSQQQKVILLLALSNFLASCYILPPSTTTQQPTTALVSFQPSQSHHQQTKSPEPTLDHSNTTTSLNSSELMNFSQLYSNQHSSSSDPLAPGRPSLHSTLQAAGKIVSGSSSSNNLIPGLSNLQSAILSHISYKIASGLSSYLQAAMKPTGRKPLIVSNMALALQYQQQMANSSKSGASTTSTTTPATNMMTASLGGVRFPADNELQVASTTGSERGSTVSFPSSTTSSSSSSLASSVSSMSSISSVSSTSPVSSTSSISSPSSTSSILPTSASYDDVVRESQRVCGRPQVVPAASTSPLPEGANKRMARIVGGNQSSFGQWPWMVSLRQWRKGAFLHKCGAALLNENWAITAAHCVENVKVTDLLLRLGEFDVSNQEEPYPFVERRVKIVKSHPLFNPKTFEYDLALLKFAEPIKYEKNIIPVCVPSGNDSYIDRMATVIGWGRLYEDGPLPDMIQHVDVPIITNDECEKMYKNAGYIEEIPDMFICAGISKGGRDSCEGDSGGPLTMVDHDGRSYLVGIISWGIGCALPSQPGVYTRITAFSGWINELAGS